MKLFLLNHINGINMSVSLSRIDRCFIKPNLRMLHSKQYQLKSSFNPTILKPNTAKRSIILPLRCDYHFQMKMKNNRLLYLKENTMFQIVSRRNYRQHRSEEFSWFTIDSFSIICVTLGLICFSTQTILAEFIIEKYFQCKNKDGKPWKLANTTLELVNDWFQSSKIDDSTKQISPISYYISKHIEPMIFGNLQSRFGTFILLPFFFDYQNINDIDLAHAIKLLNLNYDQLVNDFDTTDGVPMIVKLKECLILSNEAKKFVLTSLFHSSWLPTSLYGESMSLIFIPYLGYQGGISLKNFLPISPTFSSIIVQSAAIFGFGACALFNIILKYFQYRFGYLSVFHYEIGSSDSNESMESKSSREEFFNGAMEYFSKTEQLKSIIKQYSTKSSSSFLNFFSLDHFYPIDERCKDVKHFNRLSIENSLGVVDVFKKSH